MGLDDETRFYIRPQKRNKKITAARRRGGHLRVAGEIHGVNEFPIRFPSIKIIILPSQRGWLSSTMSAIKALYPPLIRVKEKEVGEKTPGCFSAGVLLHGLPFASFRNDMKYRTNNKKGKTRSSCHRGISTGGMVTTYTAPHSSGSLGRRPLSGHG